MALQSGNITFFWPTPFGLAASSLSHTSFLLDSDSEKVAAIFVAPKSGTIANLHFRTGAMASSGNVECRLEIPDTNGDPSGTLWATGTNTTINIPTADANSFKTASLTSGAVVTKGDILAFVVQRNTGETFIGNVAASINNMSGAAQAYVDHFTGAWAKTRQAPVVVVRYSDDSLAPVTGAVPWLNTQAVSLNSTSAPDERAVIFQIPFPARATGYWCYADWNVADFNINLYDSDGTTVLLSDAVDGSFRVGGVQQLCCGRFAGVANLLANTNYRLSLMPTTGANIFVSEALLQSASHMDQMDGGQNVHLSVRSDAGGWTQTTTTRPLTGLIFDAFDSGTTGGGTFISLTGQW